MENGFLIIKYSTQIKPQYFTLTPVAKSKSSINNKGDFGLLFLWTKNKANKANKEPGRYFGGTPVEESRNHFLLAEIILIFRPFVF